MAWNILESGGVATVWMNSNNVNRQNRDFFLDLEEALDRLESDFAHCPIVLTSDHKVFSAGFDFDYWFPLIARGSADQVQSEYDRFKKINLRLFSYPLPTVAAINGHAYAGGLITALCCDYRVVVNDNARLTLNEVPIGLAMPSLFTEIIRYALGTQLAAKATLTGHVYQPAEALRLGMVDDVVEPVALLRTAIDMAKRIEPDCLTAYGFSKRALQAPAMKMILSETDQLDSKFGETWCSADARSATARTYRELKNHELLT